MGTSSVRPTIASPIFLGTLTTLLCAGLFLVGNDPAYVHPDEHFYTDAAIQMVQTGDYWTPFYPDGRIRLEKPILTYWMLAGSFRLFGINLLASRIPSVVAGVLLVWVTFRLACIIAASRLAAILAAIILAGNIQLLSLSIRATPDVLLCLFTLMSMLGFGRILFHGDRTCIGPLLVFVGIGLGVQTKGLAGLWPLATIAVFWLIAKPEQGMMKKLLHWPAIVIGSAVALFWYGLMFHWHGNAVFRGLYEDQLGPYVTVNPLSVLGNAAAYVWASFQNFLPWVLLLLVAALGQREAWAAFWRHNRLQALFCLIPFLLLSGAFSFGTIRSQRYFMPALPLLTILAAAILVSVPLQERVWKWVKGILWVPSAVGVFFGAALVVAEVNGCGLLFAGGLAALGIGIAGIRALHSDHQVSCYVWIAASMVTAFVLVRHFLQPLAPLGGTTPVAKRLLQQFPTGTRIYTWQMRPSRAGLLRLLTKGQFPICELAIKGERPVVSDAQIVVASSAHQEFLGQIGFEVALVEPDTSVRSRAQHLAQRFGLKNLIRGRGSPERYWLATRRGQNSEEIRSSEPEASNVVF